jgi:hypothetical protein
VGSFEELPNLLCRFGKVRRNGYVDGIVLRCSAGNRRGNATNQQRYPARSAETPERIHDSRRA